METADVRSRPAISDKVVRQLTAKTVKILIYYLIFSGFINNGSSVNLTGSERKVFKKSTNVALLNSFSKRPSLGIPGQEKE